MKFGKEFASQMVPEWQEAYMDYKYLKTVLKSISMSKQPKTPTSSVQIHLKRRESLYRAFSGLTNRYRGSPKKQHEDEVILTGAIHQPGSDDYYQTMFLKSTDQGAEYELVFFKRLDDEFNKVVKFYKKKVDEMVVEAKELSKQMDVLIAFRIKVENPIVGFSGVDVVNISASSSSIVHPYPVNGRRPDKVKGGPVMDVIPEVEMTNEESQKGKERKAGINGYKPAALEILDHIKINVRPETPVSTLKGIVMSSKADLSFSKEELKKAEGLMSRAFVEFNRKLQILKSYCFLNQLAFSKIMKKYDKITSRKASKAYLEMVDSSFLGSSDEVTRLMERVENTFIKHFANGNHSKGMNILRPKVKRERHRITFFSGLFVGCSIALILAIVTVIRVRNILESEGRNQYMENIFPLYSLFVYIILHMLMFSANIYFWRRYRVNYIFMFGLKQGTEMGAGEVFLLGSTLSVLTLAGVLSNLEMDMEPNTESYRALTELVPLGLLIIVLLIVLCPLNIMFRSSRFFFLQCLIHCICAPLYKVILQDFFLADQLTSQVQAFRSLEFYICYYGWGDFKRRTNECNKSKVFEVFYYVVAMVPYWIRSLQCLRRLVEEKSAMQGLNGLKYFSTIIAVAMRTSNEINKGMSWKIVATTTSAVATLAGTYWDIVIDWGLLQRNSKNRWLRDKLLIPNKSIYFIAMVLNVLLRLAWMQSVLGLTGLPFLHRKALVAVVACLEIIRRGIWNFFRLENEHLNNVGKYRAFKSVPLPFDYDNDEDNKNL